MSAGAGGALVQLGLLPLSADRQKKIQGELNTCLDALNKQQPDLFVAYFSCLYDEKGAKQGAAAAAPPRQRDHFNPRLLLRSTVLWLSQLQLKDPYSYLCTSPSFAAAAAAEPPASFLAAELHNGFYTAEQRQLLSLLVS